MKRCFVLILMSLLFLAGCGSGRNSKENGKIQDDTYLVMEATEKYLLVAEMDRKGNAIENAQYSVPNWFYPSTEIKAGYKIRIIHTDEIAETFPMQFAEISFMEYYDRELGLVTSVGSD